MHQSDMAAPARLRRGTVPPAVKYAFTAFLAVLVPVYWRHYGPANFLWFSDLALFAAAITLWTGHPLPASTLAVGVLAFEAVWAVDFALLLALGESPLGATQYMASPEIPVAVRAVSLFHLGLPVLLLWLACRLGYDRRAWSVQSVLALAVLPLTYLVSEPDRNINWVFGPGGRRDVAPPLVWLGLLMVLLPLAVYWPTHRFLAWWAARTAARRG